MIGLLANPVEPPETLDYPTLLGSAAWNELPRATRARFSEHAASFTGTMTLNASTGGRWLARLCRLIGSPLPPASSTPVAASVRVEPDPATGGSRWIRRYTLPNGPVEIHSVKAVGGDGRLVERLGMGLRMQLDVRVRNRELHFVSTGYFFEWLNFRVWLPSWSLPGRTHVVHRDLGDGRFQFTMTVRHAWLGELFNHDGIFCTAGGRP